MLSGSLTAIATAAWSSAAGADEFDVLVGEFAADPGLARQSRGHGEAQALDLTLRGDRSFTRAFAPRGSSSERAISTAARSLIIACEVTGQAVYSRFYQAPTWPGAESGVTIGVGYDLGFIRTDWLAEDWGGHLPDGTRTALEAACGLRGSAAKAFCDQRRQLRVPWSAAEAQFLGVLLPRYVAETLISLPGADALSDDCLGALVSLVYNRGAAFRKAGPRYREMRDIWTSMRQRDLPAIPDHLLSMRRLWPDLAGLTKRREAEAALFRRGLVA